MTSVLSGQQRCLTFQGSSCWSCSGDIPRGSGLSKWPGTQPWRERDRCVDNSQGEPRCWRGPGCGQEKLMLSGEGQRGLPEKEREPCLRSTCSGGGHAPVLHFYKFCPHSSWVTPWREWLALRKATPSSHPLPAGMLLGVGGGIGISASVRVPAEWPVPGEL